MTTVDYYIPESSAEWEAFERWENEGGRLRQNDEANYVAGRAPAAGAGQTLPEAVSAA